MVLHGGGLRVIRQKYDLVQHRADFYAGRHLWPQLTDEQFDEGYVEENLPTVNEDNERFVVEVEQSANPGFYFSA
jgi:hypothetical protein